MYLPLLCRLQRYKRERAEQISCQLVMYVCRPLVSNALPVGSSDSLLCMLTCCEEYSSGWQNVKLCGLVSGPQCVVHGVLMGPLNMENSETKTNSVMSMNHLRSHCRQTVAKYKRFKLRFWTNRAEASFIKVPREAVLISWCLAKMDGKVLNWMQNHFKRDFTKKKKKMSWFAHHVVLKLT